MERINVDFSEKAGNIANGPCDEDIEKIADATKE